MDDSIVADLMVMKMVFNFSILIDQLIGRLISLFVRWEFWFFRGTIGGLFPKKSKLNSQAKKKSQLEPVFCTFLGQIGPKSLISSWASWLNFGFFS
jgi:hypothetical protein